MFDPHEQVKLTDGSRHAPSGPGGWGERGLDGV